MSCLAIARDRLSVHACLPRGMCVVNWNELQLALALQRGCNVAMNGIYLRLDSTLYNF